MGEIRQAVVDELFAATVGHSDVPVAELLLNATEGERMAVAERHAQLAELNWRKAAGLARAVEMVGARMGHGSLGALLKTCEPRLRERVLRTLFASGWTEAEVGLPDPPPSTETS